MHIYLIVPQILVNRYGHFVELVSLKKRTSQNSNKTKKQKCAKRHLRSPLNAGYVRIPLRHCDAKFCDGR